MLLNNGNVVGNNRSIQPLGNRVIIHYTKDNKLKKTIDGLGLLHKHKVKDIDLDGDDEDLDEADGEDKSKKQEDTIDKILNLNRPNQLLELSNLR